MRINCESVVKNETARLFYGILPLIECFLAAVIPVISVIFSLPTNGLKCIHKENSFSP